MYLDILYWHIDSYLQKLHLFAIFSSLWSFINTTPISYQYVSFIQGEEPVISPQTRYEDSRPSRSYQFSPHNQHSTPPDVYVHEEIGDVNNLNNFGFEENNGHITPDFSNGLGKILN